MSHMYPVSELLNGGEVFTYDGRTGGWTCTIYRIHAETNGFCAVADITLHGEPRCKLVLSRPRASGESDIESLKQKCIAWIEIAEAASDSRQFR